MKITSLFPHSKAPRTALLWVDDSPADHALILDRPMRAGHRVDIAESTADALRLAAKRNYTAIVTTGTRMEDSTLVLDAGIELTKAVRRTGATTPVLVLTDSHNRRVTPDKAAAAGADLCTSSATELLNTLAEHGLG